MATAGSPSQTSIPAATGGRPAASLPNTQPGAGSPDVTKALGGPISTTAATSPATTVTPSGNPQYFDMAQLAQLWIQAGGSPAWADTMAAVAYYGESGGQSNATNASSGAAGLWQIASQYQSDAFNKAHPPASMHDPLANAKAAVALFDNGPGIVNWKADYVGQEVIANGNKPFDAAQLAAVKTNISAAGGGAGTANAVNPAPIDVGGAKENFAAPMAGVDLKNFHGFDLSSFANSNNLGNAEKAIEAFADPKAVDSTGLNLQQRIAQDYGYTVGWALQHPEVGAVLIWAAAYADPSTAAGRAQELSQLQKTTWYQTTNENKRAWEQTQATDPAKAASELADAQDKVQATANQIGVTLSAKQLHSIALTYASLAATPEGVLGAVSGTSQEQLDQMVVDAVTTVQKTGGLPGVDTTASFNPGAFKPTAGTTTGDTTGIAGQLAEQFKSIAQQYMLYSSSPSSPLTDATIQQYVASALQNYTGSGSYGSSNLINGAVANFTAQMQAQAAQLYPSMAAAIKMGTTPSTYAQPIQSLVSNTLGINSNDVDLTSPKWNWTIATPAGGAAPTQDQILQKLVTMPEYDTSNNAVDNAHAVSNSLMNLFGTGGS